MTRFSPNLPVRTWSRMAYVSTAAIVITFGIGFSIGGPARAQQQRNPVPVGRADMPDLNSLDNPVYGADPMKARIEERRLRYLNAERQKTMVAQTNRLVKMASDLNAQINGPDKTPITPDQVRQLAEIEKLARGIRDKMSMSVRPAPSFDTRMPAPFPGR